MIRARPVTFAGGLLLVPEDGPEEQKEFGGTPSVDQNRNERKRGAIKSVAVEGCVSYEEAFKRFANQFATACPQCDKY